MNNRYVETQDKHLICPVKFTYHGILYNADRFGVVGHLAETTKYGIRTLCTRFTY